MSPNFGPGETSMIREMKALKTADSLCQQCMSRRDLICSAAACVAGLGLEPARARTGGGPARPLVRVAFVRPRVDRYFMGWPGATYDIRAREADYRKVLTGAAAASGVQLEIAPDPVADEGEAASFAGAIKTSPPDGVVLVIQSGGGGNRWIPSSGNAAIRRFLSSARREPLSRSTCSPSASFQPRSERSLPPRLTLTGYTKECACSA